MHPSVTRFSALLMKSSRNSAPVGLLIAQDIYKEYHFRIIIEKYGASVKIKPEIKTLQNELLYWRIYDST